MERVGDAEKTQIHTEVDILKSLTHKVMKAAHRARRTQSRSFLAAVLIVTVALAACCRWQHILTFFAYFDLPDTKQIVFITEIMTSGTLKQ